MADDYTPGLGPLRDAWRHERTRRTGIISDRKYNAEFDRAIRAYLARHADHTDGSTT